MEYKEVNMQEYPYEYSESRIRLPETFTETIASVHGKLGEQWLHDFNRLLTYCERKGHMRVLDPYPLSYNFVAPVVFNDGTEAVLKMSVPCTENRTEIEALRLFAGKGMVKLIEADAARGVIMLEKIVPGELLHTIKDEEQSTMIAAEVMKKLSIVAATDDMTFPTTAEWALGLDRLRSRYDGSTGRLPEAMVQRAELLFSQLHATLLNPRLLHGDLHHGNIVSTDVGSWIAIDPKGVIGEAEYEVIPFLMNHLPEERTEEIILRRIDLFVKALNLRKERVIAWGFCHAVLSAWWCLEDQVEGAEDAIHRAALFEKWL